MHPFEFAFSQQLIINYFLHLAPKKSNFKNICIHHIIIVSFLINIKKNKLKAVTAGSPGKLTLLFKRKLYIYGYT